MAGSMRPPFAKLSNCCCSPLASPCLLAVVDSIQTQCLDKRQYGACFRAPIPRFQRDERSLRQALDHQKVLLDEISHRVKNNPQLVASMFSLQATATQNAGLHRVYRTR